MVEGVGLSVWVLGVVQNMAKTPVKGSKSAAAPASARLNDGQVEAALRGAAEWSELGDTIQRTFQFRNFVESMTFVQEVAGVAESDQHHPDILIRYNKVTLTLSTHDSGGITQKDFDAARKYDARFDAMAVKR